MNKILSTKALTSEQGDKIINDFSVEDYANRDSSEIQATISLLKKFGEETETKIEDLAVSSGQTELIAKAKSIDNIIKNLFSILAARVEPENLDDKTLLNITKDDVVQENGETHTNEVVDSTLMFVTEIKYHFASVEDYNTNKNVHLTEEVYYENLVRKFLQLELSICFKIGPFRLSSFESDVAEEIVDKNVQWHTLVSIIKADVVKLNSLLNLYPEKREILLDAGYIVKEHNVKTKAPGRVQLSLFDEEEEVVNVIPDDEAIDDSLGDIFDDDVPSSDTPVNDTPVNDTPLTVTIDEAVVPTADVGPAPEEHDHLSDAASNRDYDLPF